MRDTQKIDTAAADSHSDTYYMERALQLAAYGAGFVSPNPMVGAVLVSADGRIIGEGWHRRYGDAHAEVNCMNSVADADLHLIKESTMYVTLEPCSHYGKTPPCAEMLCRSQVRRVVVGTGDPNPRVSGRGINMLRQAGIEVTEDCLRDECRRLNIRFFTAHILHRPWILLKYARTAEGRTANSDGSPLTISSPLTKVLMHAERAMCDAIMVGTNTLMTDNPRLDNRLWPGQSPRPVIFDSPRIDGEEIRSRLRIFDCEPIMLDPAVDLEENMHILFAEHGITSMMVEGGMKLINSFKERKLYDRERIETLYTAKDKLNGIYAKIT